MFMQAQSKISLKYTIQHLISKIMGASLYLQNCYVLKLNFKTSNISYRTQIQKVRKNSSNGNQISKKIASKLDIILKLRNKKYKL